MTSKVEARLEALEAEVARLRALVVPVHVDELRQQIANPKWLRVGLGEVSEIEAARRAAWELALRHELDVLEPIVAAERATTNAARKSAKRLARETSERAAARELEALQLRTSPEIIEALGERANNIFLRMVDGVRRRMPHGGIGGWVIIALGRRLVSRVEDTLRVAASDPNTCTDLGLQWDPTAAALKAGGVPVDFGGELAIVGLTPKQAGELFPSIVAPSAVFRGGEQDVARNRFLALQGPATGLVVIKANPRKVEGRDVYWGELEPPRG